MEQERYSVLFSSQTGNTKILAQAIAQALPAADCDYFGDYQGRVPSSPVLFVGFWTDKGTADAATLELLKTVKNKKIFLFGTAGFGGSAAYFQNILLRVQENLDAGNQVIGTFMRQGKMPLSVRLRYEKMKEQPNPAPNLDMLIANFDRALTHPDEQDLQRLQEAVCAVQMQIAIIKTAYCVSQQQAVFCAVKRLRKAVPDPLQSSKCRRRFWESSTDRP